ncbi:hypothetical protein BJF93_17370 [Xaviernesmea oryzae]|uniref:histidine kinase n=1 Tax=Xaviernesmea oryzae TaxID=464029 RepID=A0A1Q9AT53_9HYPH|nr:PAS domain-containing protein [Xaviernesmea oryzae]OLP58614.1 hypothetical protein BJF93_17370 [Xaviernesmea oryzae]SEK64204.1 PAS domain S-box-containing protein [Xaviernesmea oryzae]
MFKNTDLADIDLAHLFEAAPNPYVIVDRNLDIVGLNAAYCAVTMRRREELIGQNIFDAFPSDPTSVPGRLLRNSFDTVLRTGEIDHLPLIPYPIARPDGSLEERYWSATHTPIPDREGKVGLILQHTVDVTELHRLRRSAATLGVESDILARADAVADANLSLGEERSYLRGLFEQAPGFTAVLSGPDHVFDLANAAYIALVGGRDILGKPVLEALPEIRNQGFSELLDNVRDSGRPFIAHGAEVQLDRGAGIERRYLDFVYQPIRNAEGAVSGIFVQGYDVTEIKLAQQVARESEVRFRQLAQSIPNHAWAASPDGELEWCNSRVYEYSGLNEGALIGRSLGGTVHAEDRAPVMAAWEKARYDGAPFHAEVRLRRIDGQYRWHLSRALPLRDAAGAIERWIGTNTDIHDQKATEAQLEELAATLESRIEERSRELEATQRALRQSQKMEAIGNLAGGIAHDFNNLLQVVTGSLELLSKQYGQDERAKRRIDNALAATQRGARLASQLLAFGRRQPLAPRVVNLARLVRDTDQLIRRAIGEAIDIETIVGGGLWNTMADPTNVETALLNLAINARDAMGGSGKLTIELANAELTSHYARSDSEIVPGQYVLLAVTDTGTGIPAEIIDKVFDPFFSTKPEGKGTGLGLSMVYGFVKQSGGHIRIYSEVDAGTSVKIYLPRAAAEEEDLNEPEIEPAGGHETILVVEDDDGVRDTTVALLQTLGYRVLKARDAASAAALIESGITVDLLFTDVVMPGPMKSTELAERAKQQMPGVKVLFTSGYTENSIVHGGRLKPDVEFLGKPYSEEQLARKLRQVLSQKG